MPTGGGQPRRSPAHAGPLRPWERFAFAVAFLLVAAGIVALSISGARGRSAGPQASRKAAPAAVRPGLASGWGSVVLTGPGSIRFSSAAARSARLAAALAPVLRHGSGDLAAGVVDAATGAVAVYGGGRRFQAASATKADILAALLLQHQWAATPLSPQQRALAAEMIEDNSDQAAGELWDATGRAEGVGIANQALGLQQTTPADGADWSRTSTTVDDQLRLLADLASNRSPLSAGSRSYELGLMQHVTAGQAWGVTAAAVPGTASAVQSGWLSGGDKTAWAISSIGVISSDGHEMLVAVLSGDEPSVPAGIAQIDAAARAAVSAIIGGRG